MPALDQTEIQTLLDEMTDAWRDYFTYFPEYMIHIREVYQNGDEVIIIGRTTGSHLRLPRIEEFAETVIWVAKIRGNLVAEWRIYEDNPENREKLGAVKGNKIL